MLAPLLEPGVYPASVTPMTPDGKVDVASMARLLAYFESCGCAGAVLAGTNGEGPSLSAPEKRELIKAMAPVAGKLKLILGIATPSLDEAVWLTRRAEEFGATAVLVMPPGYFRPVHDDAVCAWFEALMSVSPLSVLVYNFPKMTGVTISEAMMARLANHPQMGGCKDSSGEAANIEAYRRAIKRPEQVLFVGNEQLLIKALSAGWTGTISGAANSVAPSLVQVVSDWTSGNRESAEAHFALADPVIAALRSLSQPAGHKRILHNRGIIANPSVRLPLIEAQGGEVATAEGQIKERLGL